MDGEQDLGTASVEQARYWQKIYQEILTMEEGVLTRIHELMVTQSPPARHEVELSNVPVVVAQVARFRTRLHYWDARCAQLERPNS